MTSVGKWPRSAGCAVLPRDQGRIANEIFALFPILKTLLTPRGGDIVLHGRSGELVETYVRARLSV